MDVHRQSTGFMVLLSNCYGYCGAIQWAYSLAAILARSTWHPQSNLIDGQSVIDLNRSLACIFSRSRFWPSGIACVCVSVRVCAYQSLACPHDNSSAVQARVTKFGTEVQNTLVIISMTLGDDQPWPSRSNLIWKSNFTSFELVRTITCHPDQPESPNLDQKWSFLILKTIYLTFLRCFCITFNETVS